MQIEELVPFWAKLTKEEQEELKNRILVQNVKKGTIIHNAPITTRPPPNTPSETGR